MESQVEFKRRIDSARNILVGVVPSPAGQIDQITYAMIYKFISDIDDKTARLPGGKRQYFVGEYERFDWHNLMRLDGQDKLNLYRDALASMSKNPHLPELFRTIYQNAFLPFNDPRTLNLFLKEIDGFTHTKSDAIGDAYEYLLNITGAQGDVGQFRTPRHIIRFIVDAVQPGKDDTVLDPAAGTAGFLIAAYNYVRRQHDGVDENGEPNGERRLSADERKKLYANYHGYDIDPTMVRTASVNMYLHGFSTPNIEIHDTLTSEEHWLNRYDVILANPPFMTPKGGIEPHGKFGVKATRAEVLFVDYIASHLKPNGRAGIVVPEGIIFQSGKSYKELRKNLVENYLYAVVSLPAGVFQPYSGVKTSVLLLDKELAQAKDEVLFVKVENDGYSTGANRREIAGSQFPEALEVIERFKHGEELQTEFAHAVLRSEIAESGDYNLSGDRYKLKVNVEHVEWPMVSVGEVADVLSGFAFKSELFSEKSIGVPIIRIRDVKPSRTKTYYSGDFNDRYLVNDGDILIGMDGEFNINSWKGGKALLNQRVAKLENYRGVEKLYIFYMIKKKLKEIEESTFAVTVKHISAKQIKDIKIPLPPIETQREIVAELDGYQRIIDAAQTIVKSYKPTIKMQHEWEKVELEEVMRLTRGVTYSKADEVPVGKKVLRANNIDLDGTLNLNDIKQISAELTLKDDKKLCAGDIFICLASGSKDHVGKVTYISEDLDMYFGGFMGVVRVSDDTKLNPLYLYHLLAASDFNDYLKGAISGVNINNLNGKILGAYSIPLPPIETQREIVAELTAEQDLIDANKKLIEIYQAKIKSKIAEIWGE